MTIKQIGPTAPIYSERNPGHDQEEWTAVRTLIERFNQSGLSDATKARIGIATLAGATTPATPSNTWGVYPLFGTVGPTPVNLSLASNRITYNGSAPTTVIFNQSLFISGLVAFPFYTGFRRNSDDGTVISAQCTGGTSTDERTVSLEFGFDMSTGDYIEAVFQTAGAATPEAPFSMKIYANQDNHA